MKKLENLLTEIQLLQSLSHKNVVRYISVRKTKHNLYIILEFVENGSLVNILKRFGKMSESVVALYTSQVLDGLAYLHDRNVLHRDIKGANILVTKEGTVKIADFGVSTILCEAKKKTTVVGTPFWMAPEMVQLTGQHATSDIWSLGCTLIELLTEKPPYADLPAMSALFHMVEDEHPPLPDFISDDCKDFLLLCFNKDPLKRATAKELRGHRWVMNANRDSAQYKDVTKKINRKRSNKSLSEIDWSVGEESDSPPLSGARSPDLMAYVQRENERLKESLLIKFDEDKEVLAREVISTKKSLVSLQKQYSDLFSRHVELSERYDKVVGEVEKLWKENIRQRERLREAQKMNEDLYTRFITLESSLKKDSGSDAIFQVPQRKESTSMRASSKLLEVYSSSTKKKESGRGRKRSVR